MMGGINLMIAMVPGVAGTGLPSPSLFRTGRTNRIFYPVCRGKWDGMHAGPKTAPAGGKKKGAGRAAAG